MHRLSDVLDQVLAYVVESKVELRFHLVVGLTGERDTAGRSQFLQPSRNHHTLTMAILAFNDHVAEIDADAHVDASVLGDTVVALGHRALKDNRAFNSLDDAAELGQEAVAHQFEDASVVHCDLRLEDLFAMRPKPRERIRLIPLDQSAVADHVRGQDGGEATSWRLFRHAERLRMLICNTL
jgi:hypothetical protein